MTNVREYQTLANHVLTSLDAAAQAIGQVLDSGIEISIKSDHTPVTNVDLASDQTLTQVLNQLSPAIPVLSEETWLPGIHCPDLYWLIDPIDGTSALASGVREWCVLVALIDHGTPVVGGIGIPSLNQIFVGCSPIQQAVLHHKGTSSPVRVSVANNGPVVQVASSNSGIKQQWPGVNKVVYANSGIKFAMIAQGAAHVYARDDAIRDWDAAAGHALVEAAGGWVSRLDGEAIVYGSSAARVPDLVCGPRWAVEHGAV
jgi:3'(2'), 5'-bisphosphate nucleotidase